MTNVLLLVGCVAAVAAGAVHVYIFVLESVLWRRPATWRIFGLRRQEDAETTRALAFNQGFYNLFLALTTFIGVAVVGLLESAGIALVLAGTGSMLLASLVLLSTSPRMARAAAIQGALPLVAIVLIAASLLLR